jgi:hypothetical protein
MVLPQAGQFMVPPLVHVVWDQHTRIYRFPARANEASLEIPIPAGSIESGIHKRYRKELENNAQAWQPIRDAAKNGNVSLLYSARDVEHNSALVRKEFLEEQM